MSAAAKIIRAKILARDGVQRVKITRSGEIHAYGTMPRGDGGRSPWWQLVGTMDRTQYLFPFALPASVAIDRASAALAKVRP